MNAASKVICTVREVGRTIGLEYIIHNTFMYLYIVGLEHKGRWGTAIDLQFSSTDDAKLPPV
jgi:hypothetical protein